MSRMTMAYEVRGDRLVIEADEGLRPQSLAAIVLTTQVHLDEATENLTVVIDDAVESVLPALALPAGDFPEEGFLREVLAYFASQRGRFIAPPDRLVLTVEVERSSFTLTMPGAHDAAEAELTTTSSEGTIVRRDARRRIVSVEVLTENGEAVVSGIGDDRIHHLIVATARYFTQRREPYWP